MMRALTLHQPWAWAMARGDKRIETRSWPTQHLGDLAIHAAKTIPPYAAAFIRDNRDLHQDDLTLPLGAIVAVVRVVACVALWKDVEEGDRVGSVDLTALELRWGNYSTAQGRRFGFVTEDLRPLPHPVACRGKQGLWIPSAGTETAVREQVRVDDLPF